MGETSAVVAAVFCARLRAAAEAYNGEPLVVLRAGGERCEGGVRCRRVGPEGGDELDLDDGDRVAGAVGDLVDVEVRVVHRDVEQLVLAVVVLRSHRLASKRDEDAGQAFVLPAADRDRLEGISCSNRTSGGDSLPEQTLSIPNRFTHHQWGLQHSKQTHGSETRQQ